MTRELDAHAAAYSSVPQAVVFSSACLERHVRDWAHVEGFAAVVAKQLETALQAIASAGSVAPPRLMLNAEDAGLCVGFHVAPAFNVAVQLATALVDSVAFQVANTLAATTATVRQVSIEGGPDADDRHNEAIGVWLSTLRYAVGRVKAIEKI
jgi:hypothetical protein